MQYYPRDTRPMPRQNRPYTSLTLQLRALHTRVHAQKKIRFAGMTRGRGHPPLPPLFLKRPVQTYGAESQAPSLCNTRGSGRYTYLSTCAAVTRAPTRSARLARTRAHTHAHGTRTGVAVSRTRARAARTAPRPTCLGHCVCVSM